jgi:hypothetical protein
LQVVEAPAQGIVYNRQVNPLGCGREHAGHLDILAQAVAKLGRVGRKQRAVVRAMNSLSGQRFSDS